MGEKEVMHICNECENLTGDGWEGYKCKTEEKINFTTGFKYHASVKDIRGDSKTCYEYEKKKKLTRDAKKIIYYIGCIHGFGWIERLFKPKAQADLLNNISEIVKEWRE